MGAGQGAVIYPPVLYDFLNSTLATINGVNVGIISIFWWRRPEILPAVPPPFKPLPTLNQPVASFRLETGESAVSEGGARQVTE